MIGLFIDTFDLYYRVKRKFNGKINFESYLDDVTKLGKITKLFAYGMQSETNSKFISCLRILGFETRFKNSRIIHNTKICDWGVNMTIDIIRALDQLDTVVFGTCNFNIIPLIRYIKERGVTVIIFASNVPEVLCNLADKVIEIEEGHLEE